jgi:valyl-tRNA synthetase
MPFISEELFQRLPRRTATEPPSICITPYPQPAQFALRDQCLEQDVEFAMSVIRTVRSMRADYQLTKTKTDLYIRCTDVESANVLKSYVDLIQALASAANIHVLTTEEEAPPIGCAIQTVSAKCEVHIMLKGLIDVDKELARLDEKKLKLEGQLNKLQEVTSQSDYLTKVPENVRQQNNTKVEEIQSEIASLSQGVERLLKIK